MSSFFSTLTKKANYSKLLYIAILSLLLPALLINLGMISFIDDEGIRSLVALEMKLSGNYITPTLLNEFYYNKPPLYNWILLGFFELTGIINEWTARIPTVFFLLAYAATVFYFFKKHFDTKFAFIMAFILITCGRIFFYESMLGLIDICYSWVIFTMFMVIYDQYQSRQFTRLFAFAYVLGGIAFLLKGLPTLVFLGSTLLGLFIWKKDYKKLWSLDHFKGMALFLLIVGGYYLTYLQFNTLNDLVPQMVKQSTRRTMLEYDWLPTVLNFFTFHFDQSFHFLPWSIMAIYLFQKNVFKKIFANDFLTFCALTFAVNIPLYWSSVEVYPRYLLMFPPLVYGPLLYLHFQNSDWRRKVVEYTFVGLSLIVCASSFAIPFIPQLQSVSYLLPKTLFLISLFSISALLYFKMREQKLLLFIVFLLGTRVAFNWFVLPDRLKNDRGTVLKQTSIELGLATKDKALSAVRGTEVEKANAFYITNARQKIIDTKYRNEAFEEDVLYIMGPNKIPDTINFQQEYEFICRHNKPYYRVVGKIDSRNATSMLMR